MTTKQLQKALNGLQERINRICEKVETRKRVTSEIERERSSKYYKIYKTK